MRSLGDVEVEERAFMWSVRHIKGEHTQKQRMHIPPPPPWFLLQRHRARFEMLNHTSNQASVLDLLFPLLSIFTLWLSLSLWLSPYLKHPAPHPLLFPLGFSPGERGWTSWSWLGQNRAMGMCQEMRKLVEILKNGGFGGEGREGVWGFGEAACEPHLWRSRPESLVVLTSIVWIIPLIHKLSRWNKSVQDYPLSPFILLNEASVSTHFSQLRNHIVPINCVYR